MNFEPEFEQKGGELRIKAVVPYFADENYKQYAWNYLKREMGLKLYDAIEQTKTPVTIDIEERIIEYPRSMRLDSAWQVGTSVGDRLEIRVTFTPVPYREVTMMRGYAEQFIAPTLLDRIYGKIRSWVYRGHK